MSDFGGTIKTDVIVDTNKLKTSLGKANTAINKFTGQSDKNSKKVQDNWTKSFKNISLAGVASITAVTVAFKSAVTTFAKTEQSLANVKAVTNASAEEFAKLEEAAENAGRTTRFTASQSADALFFLSSAGLDATQSIEALEGVLLLAGATGSDLSQAAQTVTATLAQFGLEAEKSTDVVNIFAAANSNSQATLGRLQNALRQVGPVAGGLNKDLEETVGVLQLLFNAGFEGETAGRGLKSALADLGNESSVANAKLAALGLNFDQLNPATNDLADIFGVLNEAGITTAQSLEIFGKVAGPQIDILIKNGREQIEKYTNAVTGTNEAARQYAVQNDTLAGSFDKFKSALEGTSNSLIKQLAPAFRAVLDTVAKVLNFITSLPVAFKGLIAGAGGAALAINAVSKVLTLLGVSASTALGPITLIASTIAGIVIAAIGATKETRAFSKSLKELKELSEGTVVDVDGLITEFFKLQEQTNRTDAEERRFLSVLKQLRDNIPDLTDDILENEKALRKQQTAFLQTQRDAANINLDKVKEAFDNVSLSVLNIEEKNRDFIESQKELGLTEDEIRKKLIDRSFVYELAIERQNDLNTALQEANKVLTEYDRQLESSTERINELTEAEKEIEETQTRANQAAQKEIDDRLAAEAVVQKQIEDRKRIEGELLEQTEIINKKLALGLITTEKANQDLIKANETLIDQLLEINYDGLSGELGDQAIRGATVLIEELTEANKEAAAAAKELEEQEIAAIKAVEDAKKEAAEAEKQRLADIEKGEKDAANAAEKANQESIKIAEEQTRRIEEQQKEAEEIRQAAILKAAELQQQAAEKAIEIEKFRISQIEDEQQREFEQFEFRLNERIQQLTDLGISEIELERFKLNEIAKFRSEKNAEMAEEDIRIEDLRLAELEKLKKQELDFEKAKIDIIEDEQEKADAEFFFRLDKKAAELEEAGLSEIEVREFVLSEIENREQESADKISAIRKKLINDSIDSSLEFVSLLNDIYQQDKDNEIAAIEEKRDLDIKAINDRIDAGITTKEAGDKEIEKLQEQSNKTLAQLQYEKALTDWEIQGALLAANSAAAIVQAINSGVPWPFNLPAIAFTAAATVAQGVLFAKSKPRPPALQTGGIILPQSGGVQTIQAENGFPELDLNAGPSGQPLLSEFAKRIADEMRGGGKATIILELNGLPIAQSTVDLISNGEVRLVL